MSENATVHTPLVGASDYDKSVDQVMAKAQHEIRVFDHALGSGFNALQRHDMLRRFFLANRRNRLRIVVHEPAHIDRNCPRVLSLLRAFSYAVSINETHSEAKLVYDPFVVVDEEHYVHRFHFEGLRGLCAFDDPIGAHGLIERFEEIWEGSQPAVTPTTLGL